MAVPRFKAMNKDLGLFAVFALATGTTLSGGFFLLPSFAAEAAGPAVPLAYLIAGILLIPPMLSKIELGTAMPRAGGVYYFLDRSLGPMFGTIGGLGIWAALMLKTAFALVGMGAYIQLFLPEATPTWIYGGIAVLLALGFGGINLLGAGKTTTFQIGLVIVLLGLLAWFLMAGSMKMQAAHFENFFGAGSERILGAAGLVFVSYVGVTKVVSVAEEIRNPERNLPLGLFLAIGTAVAVYVIGVSVMVGVSGVRGLSLGVDGETNLTPVATVAGQITGSNVGVVLMSIAAILAFLAVANAGILSASRYPLAMSRDHLLPPVLRSVDGHGTPFVGVILSTAVIIVIILFLDPLGIAKLASAFLLMMFALLCMSVVVMRETKLDSYDPGYRSPFYPWLQIVGSIACLWIIFEMGWLPVVFSVGLIVVCVAWYFAYARRRVDRYGAIFHVFERLGRKRFAALDTELREILKEKGLRASDPFDEVIASAPVIEAERGASFDEIVEQASEAMAQLLPATAESLRAGFLHGTGIGATPVTGSVALPHLRIDGIEEPVLVIVRSRDGTVIDVGDAFGGHHKVPAVHALFFLVSPEDDPSRHLRLLAQLAGHVEQEGFMARWLSAVNAQSLKENLLRDDRFVSVWIRSNTETAPLIGVPLQSLGFPEGCLVALIHRRGHMVVPRGSTVLEDGDHLTVIGDERGIRSLKDRFPGA
jgi:amino acid transporter/mannitol/fructose-specific phosphotransferase system IIA component (Ntr-type)